MLSSARHTRWEKSVNDQASSAKQAVKMTDAAALTDEELKARAEQVIQSALKRENLSEPLSMEISINHCRPDIRYQLTQKAILQEIMQTSGAAVMNRGFFRENDTSKPESWVSLTNDQKPLHLHITADSSEKVKHAAKLIEEIIDKSWSLSGGAYSQKIYVDFAENVDFSYLKMNIIGTKGCYLKHIQNVSGCKVYLRGAPNSGASESSGSEPLHLYITGFDQKKLSIAVDLTQDLLKTVKKKCDNWLKEKNSSYNVAQQHHFSSTSHHYQQHQSPDVQKAYNLQQQQGKYYYYPYNLNTTPQVMPVAPSFSPAQYNYANLQNQPVSSEDSNDTKNHSSTTNADASSITNVPASTSSANTNSLVSPSQQSLTNSIASDGVPNANCYAYMSPEYYSYYAMMYQQQQMTAAKSFNPQTLPVSSSDSSASNKSNNSTADLSNLHKSSTPSSADGDDDDANDPLLAPRPTSKAHLREYDDEQTKSSAKRIKTADLVSNYSRNFDRDDEASIDSTSVDSSIPSAQSNPKPTLGAEDTSRISEKHSTLASTLPPLKYSHVSTEDEYEILQKDLFERLKK